MAYSYSLLQVTPLAETGVKVTVCNRASNEGYPKVREDFTITEKASTKGRAAIRHYANQPPVPYDLCVGVPISRLLTVGSMPV